MIGKMLSTIFLIWTKNAFKFFYISLPIVKLFDRKLYVVPEENLIRVNSVNKI